MQEILRVEALYKKFPGVQVLKGISFNLQRGRIYSLVGENGAGKSTLVKIIMGIYKADAGTITIQGKQVKINNPVDARKYYGIDAVFQEHSLIPQLSIAENISLEVLRDHRHGSLLSFKSLNDAAEKALEKVHLDIDVSQPAGQVQEGEKSIIELAKVISKNPDIIILDEITAALDIAKVNQLFDVIRALCEQGKTIIFISHRLEEVLQLSDEILVLKDGILVSSVDNETKNESEKKRKKIIQDMTGLAGGLHFPVKSGVRSSCPPVLSVKGLSSSHLRDINLEIRENEIVCLTGLSGQGQSELLRTIAGIQHKKSGKIFVNEQEIEIGSLRDAMHGGIFYVSDRRDEEEIWPSHNITFNMVLSSLDKRTHGGIINKEQEKALAKKMVEQLGVAAPNLETIIRYLSGGNRQKVVLAKYLLTKPKILLLNQPTTGLDIEAKMEIYSLLRSLAEQGIPTLVLLTEYEEVLQLPDRLLVMYEGKIVNECQGDTIQEEQLLSSYFCN